ncbi:MAG: TdeIII family type II restriction endonuclease [candidate division WOR-3 bacterium]|nr:TdeIII family type II restriction endonuclease [candidate division WOR-3 bacterium]
MNTTFGISIWEQVAVILAKGAGNYAERQYKLLGEIDNETEELIRNLHYQLRKGEITTNKIYETEQIRKKVKKGEAKTDPDSVVDLFVKIKNEENYFDITSAKPNMKEFVALKLKLLRWTGLRLSQDKNVKIFTGLAIPYNPYHPEPYERWTLRGLYDLEEREILVGKEFWNFVANDNVYEELLDVFQKVGKELRDEIDKKFVELRT